MRKRPQPRDDLDRTDPGAGPIEVTEPGLVVEDVTMTGPQATAGEHPSAARGHVFSPGQIVAGRYRVERFIAKGGMGEVYEATDLELGATIAIKTLRPSLVATRAAIERFRREINLSRKVTHPNVCRVYDVGSHQDLSGWGDTTFLTMELLDGETLAQRVKKRTRLTLVEAQPLVEQILDGLAAAHRVGVVHRDFKLSNVILVDDPKAPGGERAVVTDFGLASTTEGDDPAAPAGRTRRIAGTPAYIAPEVAAGGPSGPGVDVYALGVAQFRMATGSLPFEGRTAQEQLKARLLCPAPAPTDVCGDVDPRWAELISRCLEADPAKRPHDADELRRLWWQRLHADQPPTRRRPVTLAAYASVALAWLALGLLLYRTFFPTFTPPSFGRPAQFTLSEGSETDPAISPDGQWVAYTSYVEDSFEIVLHNLAGREEPRLLTRDKGHNVQPSWSPDGKTIAYSSLRRGGIHLVDVATGRTRPLLPYGSSPAWSPDGKTIAFQTGRRSEVVGWSIPAVEPSTLWLVDIATGHTQRVTEPGRPEGGHGAPAWSPDGRRIVFTSSSRLFSRLWSLTPEGKDLQRLAPDFESVYNPSFDREGASLYFAAPPPSRAQRRSDISGLWRVEVSDSGRTTRGPAWEVSGPLTVPIQSYAVAPDGRRVVYAMVQTTSNLVSLPLDASALRVDGAPTLMTRGTGRASRPQFSPDGRWIAFDRWKRGHARDVWLMAADGSGLRNLTSADSDDTQPSWLPDSRRLVFISDRQGRRALWILDVVDPRPRPYFTAPVPLDWALLSPEGQHVAYHRRGGESGARNVWRADLPEGTSVQLTHDRESMGFPIWSPTGRHIAFEVQRDAETELMLMNSDGTEQRQLTHDGGQTWPYGFSPDGRWIAAAAQRQGLWNIYAIEVATGKHVPLTSYRVPGDYVRYPTWSPRGDRIVFERAETTGDLWIAEVEDAR